MFNGAKGLSGYIGIEPRNGFELPVSRFAITEFVDI